MNLAPPKIVAENKVNISHIHCMERASERSKPGLADIVAENEVNISHIHCMEQASERSKPGLADIAADCSAPCGPIWPKFYVVNGLGYGNR